MFSWTEIGMAFIAGIKSFAAVTGFCIALFGVLAVVGLLASIVGAFIHVGSDDE